jgi:hypothetical protein
MTKSVHPELDSSPLLSITAAGYVHKLFLYHNTINLELDEDKEIQREQLLKAAKDSWAVLIEEEYYFARLALRGGRTEVRKFFYEGEISDVDIQSEYPACQIMDEIELNNSKIPLEFPVGTPTIELFYKEDYPCHKHYFYPEKQCDCLYENKSREWTRETPATKPRKMNLIEKFDTPQTIQSNHEYISTFKGFIMVDVTPPTNLYHPVLPEFKDFKCMFDLLPKIRKVYTHPELQLAIQKGYQVTKIYRADRYKFLPSLWADLLGTLYKMKLYSSRDAPTDPIERQRFKTTYQKYNIDIDFNDWGNRPAMKLCAKILLNSAWGKHAESPDHEQTLILSDKDGDSANKFYRDHLEGKIVPTNMLFLGQNSIIKFKESRTEISYRPKLKTTYLPAAIFCPMYGRLMLFNHLDKLGERVLMCDTDSIKYITGSPTDYQIPTGDCIGDWETEEPTNSFVSLGPKTYCQIYPDGKELMKLKGLSIKYSHEKLINFKVMKELLNNPDKIVSLPQMTFIYKPTVNLTTHYYLKDLQFQLEILKGKYDPIKKQLYPLGFIE